MLALDDSLETPAFKFPNFPSFLQFLFSVFILFDSKLRELEKRISLKKIIEVKRKEKKKGIK